jgi:hypothetical protein
MLGDVVISEYVVQSDFGRRLPDGLAVRKIGLWRDQTPRFGRISASSSLTRQPRPQLRIFSHRPRVSLTILG